MKLPLAESETGSNKRKVYPPAAKITIPVFSHRKRYLRKAEFPYFRFKKDLIIYLNLSLAVPKIEVSASIQPRTVGISTAFRQAAGNSNLKLT